MGQNRHKISFGIDFSDLPSRSYSFDFKINPNCRDQCRWLRPNISIDGEIATLICQTCGKEGKAQRNTNVIRSAQGWVLGVHELTGSASAAIKLKDAVHFVIAALFGEKLSDGRAPSPEKIEAVKKEIVVDLTYLFKMHKDEATDFVERHARGERVELP